MLRIVLLVDTEMLISGEAVACWLQVRFLHPNSQRVSHQLDYKRHVIKSALGNYFVQPYLTWEWSQSE